MSALYNVNMFSYSTDCVFNPDEKLILTGTSVTKDTIVSLYHDIMYYII